MIGKKISHYKILEKLGEGGMGVVYKAQDTKLDRVVALKFLPKHLLCDAEAKTRFVHEAKAASALNHTNITTIYEIDEVEGECFICMEYIEGQSIKELIKERTLSIDEILKIAIQIAEGLNDAHRKGVIHRYIKSDNILITNEGVVKITDFGLAKLKDTPSDTMSGTMLGTLQYMSPEQARGQEVDHQTDIWSFGVVLYEMITSQLPFKSEDEQSLIYSILHNNPWSGLSLRTDTSLKLERIIRRMLEKNRTKRYQSILELAVDLYMTKAANVKSLQQEKLIVVLPFKNLNPNQEYFSDGLTEEMISGLSQVAGLQVIPARSVKIFKDTDKKVPEIAREFNVHYVLSGSVGKTGNTLQITAEFTDAKINDRLWEQKYAGILDGVFDIQESITRAIAETLQLTFIPRDNRIMAKRSVENIAAYDYYLRANHEILRFTEDVLNLALQYIQHARDTKGDNALLYSAMAWVYFQYANFVFGHEDYIEKAIQYVEKALDQDPDSPQANAVLGWIILVGGNSHDSFRYFNIALAAKPDESLALQGLAEYYIQATGIESVTVPLTDKLLQIDPLNWISCWLPGEIHLDDCECDFALEPFRRVYQMDPKNPDSLFHYAWTLVSNRKINDPLSIHVDVDTSFLDDSMMDFYVKEVIKLLSMERTDTALKVFAMRLMFGEKLSMSTIASLMGVSRESVRISFGKIWVVFQKAIAKVEAESFVDAGERLNRLVGREMNSGRRT